VAKLGINLGFLIFQLINFGLLYLVLSRLVWPRVIKMLDERQARIATGLEDARAAEQARQNAERERDKILAQARADGQKLADEARQRGEEQVKQMLRDAAHEAEERRAEARTGAEEERNRILADTREQIVTLAVAAAERLIGEELDQKRQRVTLQKFFAEIPAEAKGLGKDGKVQVVSAVPLTDDEKAEVARVTGAQMVDYCVEPSILGGLILRAGDKVVNGSVRGDLTALAARLR
jgi:F-type H+-transporting ATPase subunit b